MADESLWDAMVDAVVEDDAAAVAHLLEQGAAIDARNGRGETAFSYACANNSLAVAKYLYACGADINTIDAGGGSPLDWALCWSSPVFREWLMNVGGQRHAHWGEQWPWPPRCGESQ